MVALRPDELPAELDAERYLLAAAGLEAVGRWNAAETAYRTALHTWPESSWPLLGLANVAYLRGNYAAAEPLYRQLIRRDPQHLTARYNLADTLIQQGCIESARRELQDALAMADAAGIRQRLQARLAEIAAASDSGACALESR
jgi:tetratricopeptide (TPR) repeat protein